MEIIQIKSLTLISMKKQIQYYLYIIILEWYVDQIFMSLKKKLAMSIWQYKYNHKSKKKIYQFNRNMNLFLDTVKLGYVNVRWLNFLNFSSQNDIRKNLKNLTITWIVRWEHHI